jgi:NAD(P)-dependent dehydrogenase (short-subunit alcohol dehydrogenase family)
MPKPRKVCLCVGASRGIGRQIAVDLAKNGFTVVVAAKTTSDASKCVPFPPDPNSNASTINTVAREIAEAGGQALAVAVDVRSAESINAAVATTIDQFGHLDVVVYNSGAIW